MEQMSRDLLLMLANPDCPNYAIMDRIQEEALAIAEIYVVIGERGSHSDHAWWDVGAFLNEETAHKLLADLIEWAVTFGKNEGCDLDVYWQYQDVEECPLDPNFKERCGYFGGVTYSIMIIPLKG